MFAPHMTPIFATMGRPAVYLDAQGLNPASGQAVRVGGGQPQKFGPVTLYTERVCFEVLRSAMPMPAVGGSLTVDDISFTIEYRHAVERDSQGLKWGLEVSWGVPVLFRSLSGSGPDQSPPSIKDSVSLAVAAVAGDVSLTLKATYAVGKLLAGDRIAIAGQVVTVTAPVKATMNQFMGVPFSPALAADAAIGTVAALSFASDRPMRASISGYQARELQGGVVAGDLRIVVTQAALAAAGASAPKVGDALVIPDGRSMRVKNAAPTYDGSAPAFWELQGGF